MPRARHGEGPFLTDELVGAAPEVDWPRARAVAAARLASGPIHFLFHSAFCASTLVKRLQATPPDYSGACAQILRWTYAGGKVEPGLLARRKTEYRQCMGAAQ